LWIGTLTGLSRFNPISETFTNFYTQNGLYRRVDSDNGTVEHVAYHHIPGDSSSIPGNYLHIIFEDSSGRLWIGCQQAMPCYYDRENDCFIHLVDDPGNPFPSDHKPYIFHETSNNALIAAAFGAYKIIPPFTRISKHAIKASDVVEIIPVEPVNIILTGSFVSCMDSRGTVWFGSHNMGLFKWVDDSLPDNRSKGKWTIYTEMDGLAGNTIMRIEEDLNGNLWIGTLTGLSRFNPISETFTNFYTQNGLPSNTFLKSGARSPTGELFFGTTAGLVSFYPNSIKLNTSIPPVRITSFKVHNQEVIPGEGSILNRSIQFTDEMHLSHNLNTFTIGFAVLNYIEPERNQHKYMLEGLDEDWVFSGLRNNITYANLKPGNYVFRATGSNNDGVWNEEGVALSIRVMAPPWLKWWAYLIYGLILTGIILLYRHYLHSRAKLKTDLEVQRVEKEKVLEIEQMKSQFFTNISHEFRTPLSLILGPINDIQKRQDKLEEGDRTLLSIMKRNAGRLQQLINQLLDLSKLEKGKEKLQVQKGDLSVFIRSFVLSFLSLAETGQINYHYDIPNTSGTIYYDADKIEKILTNLVSNAFKFTPEGGEIKIGLKYKSEGKKNEPSLAEIFVFDSGKGIPPEQIDKIFDRFYQISSSDTREKEGTGIGLSLTKELVDIYRGEIRVDSKPGKGSKFIVTLPVSRDLFEADEIIPAPSGKQGKVETSRGEILEIPDYDGVYQPDTKPESAKGQPVILIVEDNEDLRKYISRNLLHDYQIHEAENGKQGISQAIKTIPDVVITDVMMPEMDGMEMCRNMREDERTSHIPIIMLTAKADRQSKLAGLEMGADDYIIKPFDANELHSKVKNLIVRQNKMRERFNRAFFMNKEEIEVKNADRRFIQKAQEILNAEISNPNFDIDRFSQRLGISRMQLYRKLKGLANQSPSEFIRNLRLKYSIFLLDEGYENITQIALHVGFNSPSYYSMCFRKLYGISPKEYTTGKKANPADEVK
jgi:signal transduction histidine kinase/DNA-binding response OmpR family regulator